MSLESMTLQDLYEETARRFAQRVRDRFAAGVHSVILYGSVARKSAGEDSDIDVLVLTADGGLARDDLVHISESLDFENGFRTFLIATAFTPERLMELTSGDFPIAEAILREGVVLYDDGTFERIRKNAAGAG